MVKIKLVGCQFTERGKFTTEGEIVKLIREPNNKFDKNAIVVRNALGFKIGYVGTDKTVSKGNRANGCIDNKELGALMKHNYTRGIVSKFRDYFGFIEVDI